MTDIVERLRERVGQPGRFGYSPDLQLLADAADDIKRLRAERDHWHALVARADRAQFPFDASPLPPSERTAVENTGGGQ